MALVTVVRAVVTTGVLVAAFACTACEPSTGSVSRATASPAPSTSSSPSPAISGPVLSGTVSISGAATIPTTTFEVGAQLDAGQTEIAPPAGATCADYARGFAGMPMSVPHSFVAPALQTTGQHNIYVGVMMTGGYTGPGTYMAPAVRTLTGAAVEGIGADASAVYTVFHSGDAGSMTLTVNPDGSGSLHFEHWDRDEVRQVPGQSQVNVSGVITWVCR
jgi:hypothetical protein